jgi:hypothetical protein
MINDDKKKSIKTKEKNQKQEQIFLIKGFIFLLNVTLWVIFFIFKI